ncbi:hypothetical protein Q0N12_11260 [Rossellomorea marisflavi]|uniref:YunG family protein n=1 Tax=Rossellomorea marisflavi TaxID=189381 RepID=UPI0034577143
MEKKTIEKGLYKAWSIKSSSKWTAENPARGQCGVMALLIHDHLGGEIAKTTIEGCWHFYNMIDGVRQDFTVSQFESLPDYEDCPSTRDEAFADTSEYKSLKGAFQQVFRP